MLLRRKCITILIMCIQPIFRSQVSSYLKSESKFYRHGQIEENPPETLDERYGRHFEGVAGDNRIRLLRHPNSDQTRNVLAEVAMTRQKRRTQI